MVLASGIVLGYLTIVLGAGQYFQKEMVRKCFTDPVLFTANVLPAVVLVLILYAIIRRSYWAFGLAAIVSLGFAAANHIKLAVRDDPLMLGDLLLLREGAAMSKRYDFTSSRQFISVFLYAILVLILLILFARGRLGRRGWLRICLLVVGMMGSIALAQFLLNDSLYWRHSSGDITASWSGTRWKMDHGFTYMFLHSASTIVEHPPEGYNADEAAALLANYQDADIPEGKKVNIICIMLEAYNDFTKFDALEFTEDVYAPWHQLESEGYSGDLVSNIFAGGTVNTERCFLTGYSDEQEFRKNTNSWPWYFRSQGYAVTGMHPFYRWFYNRLNVQEHLGFEEYYFMENYFSSYPPEEMTGDKALMESQLFRYQSSVQQGVPFFSFSVSYQGHGPYPATERSRGEDNRPVVDDGRFSEEELCILDNYFASVADTNQRLKWLTDSLRTDPAPVVVVLFGDHNPWLGDGNSVYTAMGLDLDTSATKGFTDYYCTRYIIWANDAAKTTLGNDFRGEGPALSACFLMNKVFELCGYAGPAYMQAIEPVAKQVPVIHADGSYLQNGVLVDGLDTADDELVRQYKLLQYYQRNNFSYNSLVKGKSAG